MKTRSVDRFRAKDYLKRAEQCRNSMERSFEAAEWDSCVIGAIHCGISSADALCVFKIGVRNASENHSDAIALFRSIDDSEEIKRGSNHLSSLLSIKTDAEYGERLQRENDAILAMKHAKRIFEFVKLKIP